MRKYIKKEILAITQTMNELSEAIWKECEYQNYDQAIELMQDAQQAAISIGETVEKIEGEGTEAIPILEEFCEHIFHLSERLGTDDCNIKKEEKILRKFIIKIENSICHLQTTYEVVFFPYKASMWDCMESVYKAAVSDPDCKAYVVPIPYVEMKNGGTIQISRYEGAEMPEDIPVTNYKDYNLEARKPDAAFVHNPYDNINLITSVDSRYFSSNLKKYVECLVYIPYYVIGGLVPDNHRMLPVHMNMDKMITQAEGNKKYYDNKVFQNKLLPLGSPKFDKIISYEHNKPEIPTEWEEVLDGKKVFFYNVSLSSILNDTENAMKKMKYVFNVFADRKDVAILWRPHPLAESSLASMRPQFYSQYMELKSQFIQEGIGVLDETSDVDRAVALSDTYIGETTSSIIHLFGVVGKPLFVLDTGLFEELSDREKTDPRMTNIVEYNSQYWTFMCNFNALCNIDVETGEVNIVTTIPGESILKRNLVSKIVLIEDTLVLMPNWLQKITLYNLKTNEFDFIEYEEPKYANNLGGMFEYKDQYLIIPNQYPAFIRLDWKTKRLTYIKEIMKDVMQYGQEYNTMRGYFGGTYLKDNLLYISLCRTNKIVELNLDTCKHRLITLGEEHNTYGQMLPVKEGVLIRSFTGFDCYYWNMEDGTFTTVALPQEEEMGCYPTIRGEYYPFCGFYQLYGKTLLLPNASKMIYEFDRETFAFKKSNIDISSYLQPLHSGVFDNRWGHVRMIVTWNNDYVEDDQLTHLRIIFNDDGSMMDYNAVTDTYRTIQPHLNLKNVKKFISVERSFDEFNLDVAYACLENQYITLSDFIDAVVEERLHANMEKQRAAYDTIAANLDGTCGEKVYAAIKKEIED